MKHMRPWLYISLVFAATIAFTATLSYASVVGILPECLSGLIYWGPVPGIIALYYLRLKGDTMGVGPERAAESLARELMSTKYLVKRLEKGFSVRLGRSAGAVVRARPTSQGCQLYYGLDTTPRGTAWIAASALLIPPISLLVVLYYLVATVRFGTETLGDMTRRLAGDPMSRERGVKDMLTESLSEARRLSLDAYEALKSDYEDLLLISFVMGLFVLLAVLLAFVYMAESTDISMNGTLAFIAGVAAFFSSMAASVYLVRRKYRPRLERVGVWKDRLSIAFEDEGSSVTGEITPYSHFELLAEASNEIHEWLDIRRNSMLAREPLLSMLMVYAIYIGVLTVFGGAIAIIEGSYEGLIALAIGAAAVAFGLEIHRRSSSRRAAEAAALKENWIRRSCEMTAKMESFLVGRAVE